MDEFEENIRLALKKDIQVPVGFENSIKSALYRNNNRNYLKKVITALITLLFGTGIVFATNYEIIYEKIFKEPKQFSMNEKIENILPIELTDEEKEKEVKITEERAKELAMQKFNNLGFENVKIERIELQRGYLNNPYYIVKTKYSYEDGMDVIIDAVNGMATSFDDRTLKYNKYEVDKIEKEIAIDIAKEKVQKFGVNIDEYELYDAEEREHYFNQKCVNQWDVFFDKYYDSVVNLAESVKISFFVINGEVKIESIYINTDNSFENNKVVFTKEEAIQIAKNKENEFSDLEIKNISAEISIENMNSEIYELEPSIDLYEIIETDTNVGIIRKDECHFETPNIRRKVWKVNIEHKKIERNPEIYFPYMDYIKKYTNKEYYVDCTTGEIIGGHRDQALTTVTKELLKNNTSEEYYNKVLENARKVDQMKIEY